jgi:prepilin-type N-terminal cleavage/methylation domain-containing protein
MMISSKKGFTLIEVSAAVALLVLTLSLALAGYMFALKNINQGDVQNELDMDVQLAMERLKIDLRLSSLDTMFYHPFGAGPYKALSFPMAEDSDGDGVLEEDGDGNIIWDRTVIYHIRPTTPNQLVKTIFEPRNESLSDAQRQAQLESVVKYGVGDHTYNGQNASSDVIFENLLHWEIRPEEGRFDAYSPVLTRDSSSLGYILMDPGSHEIIFRVTDKNTASTGYKIGIDQLFASPSYSAREGEAQLPATAQSGASASSQYMSGDWKGNYQLIFPATGVGNSFTLTLENDLWEETNFGAIGYEAEATEFVFDETLSPKDFVVQLHGNDVTWTAEDQTFSPSGNAYTNAGFQGSSIVLHINGSQLFNNGDWLINDGKKCQLIFEASALGGLQVDNVYISKTDAYETLSFGSSGTPKQAFFGGLSTSPIMLNGSMARSDWIDLEINITNNYVVSFDIANNVANCYPVMRPNLLTSITNSECMVNGGLTNYLIGLSSIIGSYAEQGVYTSQIFDTHLTSPQYGDISWSAETPTDTSIAMKVRAGSNPDLSDASDWSAITGSSVNPHAVGTSYSRYVQFQAILTPDPATYTKTPLLKDVTIDWGGERQLVNIGGIFTMGPDYGMFDISVDGDPLRSALIVDLEIYRDERVVNHETRRITSSLQADLTPRNSGK